MARLTGLGTWIGSLAAHGALAAAILWVGPTAAEDREAMAGAGVQVEMEVVAVKARATVETMRVGRTVSRSSPGAGAGAGAGRRGGSGRVRGSVPKVTGDPFAGEGTAGHGTSVTREAATGPATGPATAAVAEDPVRSVAVADPAPDVEGIRSRVQAELRYPRLARSRKMEGRVVVRFMVKAGVVAQVAVVESAGDLLDNAAIDAVRRAGPYATVTGWVRIPVRFDLDKVL